MLLKAVESVKRIEAMTTQGFGRILPRNIGDAMATFIMAHTKKIQDELGSS